MIDRPLDEDEGESVAVDAFQLEGATPRPEYGIEVSEIEEILAEARREQGSFTIGQLQAVADRITNYYRERGLILSQAVVPAQTVDDGEVTLEVIEGKLGAIRPEGNELYAQETLESAFRGLLGEPVSESEAEAALLTLTDYPGLAAFGVFEPGQQVGEADLTLQVQGEDAFEGLVRVDNHGTETTGEGRARAQLQWNNITGNADRLTFFAQHSFDPANSVFGLLEYDRRFGRKYRAGVSAQVNRFDVGGELEDLDISGESDEIGINGGRNWIRSRDLNLSSRLNLAAKRSRTLFDGDQRDEDKLTVLSLQTDFDSVDSRFGGLNFGGLEISQGFNDVLGAMGDADDAAQQPVDERPSRRQGGSGDFPAGEFTKIFAYYSRLQNISDGQSLLLRTELQETSDLLVPLEQYSIGGADNVRAFPSSHVLVDAAVFVSAEYVIEAPFLSGSTIGGYDWSDVMRTSIFFDYAGGSFSDPRSDQPGGTVNFHGVGAAVRFDIPGTLESRFQIAWETGQDEDVADPEDVDEPQFWADVTWRF